MRAGPMTVVALELIVAGRLRLSEYLVEEALILLLGVALLLLSILLTVIVFLLLWRGASLVFRRLEARTEKIAWMRHRRARVGNGTSRPLPGG